MYVSKENTIAKGLDGVGGQEFSSYKKKILNVSVFNIYQINCRNLLYNNIKCQYFLAIWNGDEIEIFETFNKSLPLRMHINCRLLRV